MECSKYIIFSIILTAWCLVHSLLISNKWTAYLKAELGAKFRFYRLIYNLFSLVTFLPIMVYTEFHQGDLIFTWKGYLLVVRGMMLFTAFYLFVAGSRYYNGSVFLGISQLRNNTNQKSLTKSGKLNISGILGVTRHPWYMGAIVLIWARNLHTTALITNIILTVYLIVGSYWEEKKLVIEFGEQYRSYQQRVSMLFPLKWLAAKLNKRAK